MGSSIEHKIPVVFESSFPKELFPGQPIYKYYVTRRALSILEVLTTAEEGDLQNSLEDLQIEYLRLCEERSFTENMQLDALHEVQGLLAFHTENEQLPIKEYIHQIYQEYYSATKDYLETFSTTYD